LASAIDLCALSKIVSLFVARLSVFISIRRCFKENGSRQDKKQMVGMLVLDPLPMAHAEVNDKDNN
jgi:hypothetical protein